MARSWHSFCGHICQFAAIFVTPNFPMNKKKILIAENNLEQLIALHLLLGNRGYETILAWSSKQAVDIAAARLPDLILMDIMLSEIDGIEATRLIRQDPNTRSIPIIIITEGLSTTVEEECARIGCNDILSKPLTASGLNDIVTKAFNQKDS